MLKHKFYQLFLSSFQNKYVQVGIKGVGWKERQNFQMMGLSASVEKQASINIFWIHPLFWIHMDPELKYPKINFQISFFLGDVYLASIFMKVKRRMSELRKRDKRWKEKTQQKKQMIPNVRFFCHFVSLSHRVSQNCQIFSFQLPFFASCRFGKKKEDKSKDPAKGSKNRLEALSEEELDRIPDSRERQDTHTLCVCVCWVKTPLQTGSF